VADLEALALAVAAGAGREEAVRAALLGARYAAEAEWAVVHLVDAEGLVARAALGAGDELVWSDGRAAKVPAARGARSSAQVPVVLAGRVVGTIDVEWAAADGCTAERLRAIELLAAHLAVAVGHVQQRDEIERRLRAQEALLEAARIVAAAEGDLDETLDALVEQAGRLLAADAVALNLADPRTGELVVRRTNPLAAPGARAAAPGARFVPMGLSKVAIGSQRPVFSGDYQRDTRVQPGYRAQFAAVVATMAVPLLAGGELVGVLYVDWSQPHQASDDELALAEAFARHAAVAVRGARLLAEARRARGELEAVFDAVTQAVMVFAPNGQLLQANASARRMLGQLAQGGPLSADLLCRNELIELVSGAPSPDWLAAGALAGETVEAELLWRSEQNGPRRIQAVATPVRDAEGRIAAAVVAANDVTELHDAIAEQARLDGAIKTVRRVAHDIGNALALVVGYGELVPPLFDPEAVRMVQMMARGATAASAMLARLQRIARFAEIDAGGGPMLDLDAAADPEVGAVEAS